VSPQNVIVGADGVARVFDFGVAKAVGRLRTTRDGQVRGKLPYMAPEQLCDGVIDQRTDVYAAGVVLWEVLTQQSLFTGENDAAVLMRVLNRVVEPPSALALGVPKEVDAIVFRAISRDPQKRFQTAREMAIALEEAVPLASPTRVAEWVESLARDVLGKRARAVAEIEAQSLSSPDLAPYVQLETASRPVMQSVAPASARKSLRPSRRTAVGTLFILLTGAGLAIAATRGLRYFWRTAPSVTAAASPTPPRPEPAPEPPPTAPIVVVPMPSPSATPTPSRRSAAPRKAPKAPPSPPPSTSAPEKPSAEPPPKADPECKITWYLDARGIKHFVRECE
jgi:serine/threonine-protein kinase